MSDFLTPQVTVIALAVLAMLAVGGLAYALLYRRVRPASTVERRMEAIADRGASSLPAIVGKTSDASAKRRRAIQETLKEMEAKEKARSQSRSRPTLALRLQQAGFAWSRQTYILISVICGAVAGIGSFLIGAPIYAVAGLAVAGSVGVPLWFVNSRRKKRMKKFVAEFPNAVDVITRGVKAGLPLTDCLRIIANESQEPVRGEFRMIAERQQLGQTMAEAVAGLSERVPVPEANFFSIVIAIQAKAGGNLSEALSNLSKVLRERSKMRGKIKAMSMEAKASAWIIGALPIVVMALVYITSPDYIMLLFTNQVGHVILLASAFWMACGVFVMRRMINFDF